MHPAVAKLAAGAGAPACSAFQVYSNALYIVAGALGVAVGTAPPLAIPPRGRVAARVTVTLVGVIVTVTGLVSTWYHRVGTSSTCPRATYDRVGRVDVGCAVTTSAVGAAVLAPLTIYGLVRQPRAGPAVLLALSGVVAICALVLHLRLTHNHVRDRQPCLYDTAHGVWHVLGASSAVLGFCAVFLSLAPDPGWAGAAVPARLIRASAPWATAGARA